MRIAWKLWGGGGGAEHLGDIQYGTKLIYGLKCHVTWRSLKGRITSMAALALKPRFHLALRSLYVESGFLFNSPFLP